MSSVTKPRGHLSARVYWTRRLVALGLALALVFGISHLLGGGAQQSETPSARPAVAAAGSLSAGLTSSASAVPTGDTEDKTGKNEDGDKAEEVKTPLAVPTGPCDVTDVKVIPSVDGAAYAGRNVTITLNLSTLESPACTWDVSADSVVVKLTSGTDRIWTTQDCQAAIPSQSVVVRKDDTTKVDVTWSGQRSDDGCTRSTLWAPPGYYHASGAAYGAEPEDYQFQLLTPVPPTITPKPKATPEEEKVGQKNAQKSTQKNTQKNTQKGEQKGDQENAEKKHPGRPSGDEQAAEDEPSEPTKKREGDSNGN